jgi:hypothetical protein
VAIHQPHWHDEIDLTAAMGLEVEDSIMIVLNLALVLATLVGGGPMEPGDLPEKQIEKLEQTCKQERVKGRLAIMEARETLARVQSEQAKAASRIVEIGEIMNKYELTPRTVKMLADLAAELEPLKAAQEKREKDLLSLKIAVLEAEEEERALQFVHEAKRALLWRKLGISIQRP